MAKHESHIHSARGTAPKENLLLALYVWLQTWLEKQEGQDLIEYAAIVALLVIAAVGTLGVAGNSIKTVFSQIGSWVATLEF